MITSSSGVNVSRYNLGERVSSYVHNLIPLHKIMGRQCDVCEQLVQTMLL